MSRITDLQHELEETLGVEGVSVGDVALDRASVDGARMSPILVDRMPLGRAEIVAYPKSASQIADAVAAAVRRGIPITTRGKGTGNYGQAIPFSGGLVVDTSRARQVIEVGDGWITAEAGATMRSLERAANDTDQQLLIFPSTVQSTVGGFVSGGSGGTGSIKNGLLHDRGYVRALDVVHADGSAELIHVEGAAAQDYVHNYGTVGVIARVTLRLEPRQDWRLIIASFADRSDAFGVVQRLASLEPAPRLVSADPAKIIASLPPDEAMPTDRAGVRTIVDAEILDAAIALIEAAGGRVETIREGEEALMRASMLSYNHPIDWYMRAAPARMFHLEVAGDALVDRPGEVDRPGALRRWHPPTRPRRAHRRRRYRERRPVEHRVREPHRRLLGPARRRCRPQAHVR